MNKQGVAKNTTILTLAYVGQKILSFIYFVLIARFIGVEDLGKYTFALTFTTMFAVFIDLGLTQALIREVAKYIEKAGKYITSIISIKLLLSVIVYLVVVVVINIMGYPTITKQMVYLSGIIMVLDSLTLSFWGVLRGSQNLKYEGFGILINQTIIVALGLVVLLMKLPLLWLMLPFIVASTFNVIFSSIMIKKHLKIRLKPTWDAEVLKFLFKIAVPFALLGVFTRVYGNIDSVMLSYLQGDKAIGWYQTAMKIPFALQFIPAAFAAAIYPAFSNYFIHDKAKLKDSFDKAMILLAMIAVPLSFGMFSIAPEVILFLFGQDFFNSILPLQLLVLGLIFVFLNFPLGALMNGCDRHITNTKLVGATMVLNVFLNLILIPRYSYAGAAVAFLISHSMLFVAGLVVANKIIAYSKRYLISVGSKVLLSSILMAGLIIFLKQYIHFTVLIAGGAIFYVSFLYLIKGFSKAEIKYLYYSMVKKDV